MSNRKWSSEVVDWKNGVLLFFNIAKSLSNPIQKVSISFSVLIVGGIFVWLSMSANEPIFFIFPCQTYNVKKLCLSSNTFYWSPMLVCYVARIEFYNFVNVKVFECLVELADLRTCSTISEFEFWLKAIKWESVFSISLSSSNVETILFCLLFLSFRLLVMCRHSLATNSFTSSPGAVILLLAESPEAFNLANNITPQLLSLTQGYLKGLRSFPSILLQPLR